jgi:hypothetical protein
MVTLIISKRGNIKKNRHRNKRNQSMIFILGVALMVERWKRGAVCYPPPHHHTSTLSKISGRYLHALSEKY